MKLVFTCGIKYSCEDATMHTTQVTVVKDMCVHVQVYTCASSGICIQAYVGLCVVYRICVWACVDV